MSATIIDLGQRRRDNFEQERRRRAHNALDALLDSMGGHLEMDFESLSDLARQEGRKITAAALQATLQDRIDNVGRQECRCLRCQKVMRNPRLKSRTILTMHGPIEITRPYFYCTRCFIGCFPDDETLGLAADHKLQPDLERAAARLFQRLPYAEATQVFEEMTGISLSEHAMHEIAERVSKAADLKAVLPSRRSIDQAIKAAMAGKTWRPILVVAADGAEVPLRPNTGRRAGKRGSGYWKEAKGFRVYLLDRSRIVHIMSWHQIANEEDFGKALEFAASRIPQDKVRIALLGDGAAWIWSHLERCFPEGKPILDYYHASEHVHALAEELFPGDETEQAGWIEAVMAQLFYGEVDEAIANLEGLKEGAAEATVESIRQLQVYLDNNKERIDYARARRGQYPLGSGGIESANKFICHKRMKLSGAWWYEINGNAMLRLRCAMYNDTFDHVFAKYKAMEKRQLKL